jgi:hypothetical protein
METYEARDLTKLTYRELEAELATLAAHLYAGTCRWLELVGELDRRNGWAESGCGSCAEWVAWRCALDPRSAREHLRVARSLRQLPATREAFGRGELSYSKVRALTRVAEPASEAELLRLARDATAAQLERMLGAFRRVSRADAERAHSERYLHHFWDEDGSLQITARIPAEQGALVLEALEAARGALREEERGRPDPVPAAGGSAEPPECRPEPPAPGRADALVALAETALARGPRPAAAGERHRVVVHVDLDALVADAAGRVHLRDGPALSADTTRRLACDASLTPVLERGGEVLSVGRRTRAVPAAIRRALEVRDRGCRFPGCNNRRWVDAHHVHHWAHGGETKLDNLISLCRRHHRLLHEGGYTLGWGTGVGGRQGANSVHARS